MSARDLTLEGHQQYDRIELALIALLNRERRKPNAYTMFKEHWPDFHRSDMKHVARDRWQGLKLTPPAAEPILINWGGDTEALYPRDPEMLTMPVSFLLGTQCAVATYMGDLENDCILRWNVYWQLHRVPKPFRCVANRTDIYACEFRDISLSGKELLQYSLHGWQRTHNKYVPILAPGESVQAGYGLTVEERNMTLLDKNKMVIHASIVEYARSHWRVRIEEGAALWIATDGKGIKALASLRDAPLTDTGRRRPLLHWVKEHLRRTPGDNEVTTVREHLRGISTFALDTMKITIHEPHK